MTFHKLLQMYSKFDQIHLGKDQGNSNFTFLQNLLYKAVNFEFLKNSTTLILGTFSLEL
jgi:hypothetical protein